MVDRPLSMIDIVLEHGSRARLANPALASPLALAYIGDCIYDLYVRTRIIAGHDYTARALHSASSKLVCASAQARASHKVIQMLSEDELRVFKRARNAHMGTVAKNASIADYRAATGLEAVIGYTFLLGDDERLSALMHAALSHDDNTEQ